MYMNTWCTVITYMLLVPWHSACMTAISSASRSGSELQVDQVSIVKLNMFGSDLANTKRERNRKNSIFFSPIISFTSSTTSSIDNHPLIIKFKLRLCLTVCCTVDGTIFKVLSTLHMLRSSMAGCRSNPQLVLHDCLYKGNNLCQGSVNTEGFF